MNRGTMPTHITSLGASLMKRILCTGSIAGLLTSCVALFAYTPVAHALNTLTPTTTADVVDANDGVLSLREAITIANADNDSTEIVLATGQTYALTRCAATPDDTNDAGDLDHTEVAQLTVRSPGGATVTQTCPGERILHHLGTKPLNLVSLTVTGGSGHPGGGAVFSAGPTEIHFSTFTGNTTDTADADPFWTGTGGGAVSVLTTVVIRSSVFIGNSSTNSLYPQWAAGGAVWASAGGSITSSRFEQNTAQTGGGGAVHAWSAVKILRSTFTSNSAGFGGAVRILEAVSFASTITDSTFTTNHATQDGGAVQISGCGNCGTAMKVTAGEMIGNTAGANGGAIAQGVSQGGSLQIIGGKYTDNSAVAAGGAFRFQGGSQVFVSITNAAVSGNTAGTDGGAILTGFLDLTVTGGTYSNNRATGNGGVLSTHATIFGGYAGDPQIKVIDATMATNRAGKNGGAIDHPAGPGFGTPVVTVSRSSLTGNFAGTDGGAIYSGVNRPVLVDHSSIVGNTAVKGGGMAFAGPTTIDNTTIAQNTAKVGGGVLAVGDTATLTHTTLYRNTATGGVGSALAIAGGGVRLKATAITNGTGTPCSGLPQSLGANVANGTTCQLSGPNDTQTNQVLAFTMVNGAAVPSATNPVVNHYSPVCVFADDQRSIARPQGSGCDTGAVERTGEDPLLGEGDGK